MKLNRTSVLAAPVILGALFATSLIGTDRLGFRDVSHFYTPLYDYVADRSHEQWLPLWNPLDQTGIPVVGETTTAFFYPPRYLLFGLGLSSETAVSWYVTLHLVLAALTASWCARMHGASWTAASLSGATYSLSGSVLFLYTNPPFLVGATWLPLALGAFLSRRRIDSRCRMILAGGSLALMVLGGDPQSALHVMLIAGGIGLVRLLRAGKPSSDIRGQLLWPLVAAPVLAALLSAPQLAASISWSRQSDRVSANETGHWFDAPTTGSRRQEAFQYSLPPWHTAEILTPNAFGSLLPENHRVSALLPGDGRMWTPTIYMGMFAAIALLSRLLLWRRSSVDAWIAIAVASLILSFGHFGVAWVVQNVSGYWAGRDSAAGGLYWILYQSLPGYDAFRYPTKWLPLLSLATSMITATWLDRGWWRFPRLSRGLAVSLLLTLALATVAVFALSREPDRLVTGKLPVDHFWGPLNVAGGLAEIQSSLLHSIVVLSSLLVLMRLHQKRGWRRGRLKAIALMVVLIDLGTSGYGLIARVPMEAERERIAQTEKRASSDDLRRWMRTRSRGGWPADWSQSTDADRLTDVETSVRQAWFGRWHLASDQAVFNNMTSIQSRPMTTFWQATRQATASMTPEERDRFWQSVRDWLSISGVVHTSEVTIEVPQNHRTAKLVDVQTRTRPAPDRFVRFHPTWRPTTKGERSVASFAELLDDVNRRGLRAVPWLERDVKPAADKNTGETPSIRIIDDRPELLRLEVATSGGLLTRPTMQEGNWFAEIAPVGSGEWTSLNVDRVDFIKQGVLIPAGRWEVRFFYSPRWARWSIPLATLTWLTLIAIVFRKRIHRLVPQPAVDLD